MSLSPASARFTVPEDAIAAYERDGAVLLTSVLDETWVERGRAGIARGMVDAATGEPSQYFKRLRLWQTDPDLRALCLESGLAAIAAQLMRSSKVNLLYDQVFVKEPGSDAPTPWHNDHPYWPVSGTQLVTLWIAFDEVTLDNGGLEFIRGSHRPGKWYRPFDTDDTGRVTERFSGDAGDVYEELPDFEAGRSGYDVVSWDMKPGDLVAFHALAVHGARGNRRRDVARRAYAVRMTGDDVRYRGGRVWNSYITNPTLGSGEPLDSPQYPVLFDRRARA